MKYNYKKGICRLTLSLCVCWLTACSMVSTPQAAVDSLIITNLTDSDITNVVINVPATNRIVTVSGIPRGTDYSVKFPVTQAKKNPTYIKWIWRNEGFSQLLKAQNEAEFFGANSDSRFVVHIEIMNNGRVKTYVK